MILQHEKWINSGGKLGQALKLQNENLSGMKFLNFNLKWANLKNSNLKDTIIYCDSNGANLIGIKVNLNTSWIGSDLTNVKIDKDTLNLISKQLKNTMNKHKYGLNNLKIAKKEAAITKE